MSIKEEILTAVPEVYSVVVNKSMEYHGEDAIGVIALLENGKTVSGIFTSHPRDGFGGVEFSGPKDIGGLMVAKIKSVLEGTADEGS